MRGGWPGCNSADNSINSGQGSSRCGGGADGGKEEPTGRCCLSTPFACGERDKLKGGRDQGRQRRRRREMVTQNNTTGRPESRLPPDSEGRTSRLYLRTYTPSTRTGARKQVHGHPTHHKSKKPTHFEGGGTPGSATGASFLSSPLLGLASLSRGSIFPPWSAPLPPLSILLFRLEPTLPPGPFSSLRWGDVG